MSCSDDETGGMSRLPFDATTADRFLAGQVSPEDAPPGFRDLAALIQAARPQAAEETSPIESTTVAALAASERVNDSVVGEGKKKMLGRVLTVKAAAVAGALAFGGVAAAAATGSLPPSAQSAVSHGLSHVGVSVPNPDSSESTTIGVDSTTPTSEAGDNRATATADAFGQCTAWAATTKGTGAAHRSPDAQNKFPNLVAAAGGTDKIAAFCAGVHRPNEPTGASPTQPTAGNAADGAGTNHPSRHPTTPPASVPVGPPASVPVGPPASVPAGGSVSERGRSLTLPPAGPRKCGTAAD